MVADGSGKQRTRPEWLQQYELVGKIGEGTYGLVYLAKSKEPAHRCVLCHSSNRYSLNLCHRLRILGRRQIRVCILCLEIQAMT